MSEQHKRLELDFDQRLLEDVFDMPELRYVVLFMFIIRKEVFNDLIDDEIQDQFEAIKALEEPTVGDLKRICSDELLKSLLNFNLIMNIKSYEAFQSKNEDFKIRLTDGLKLTHESVSEEEEEIHIFMNENVLERIIAPKNPEMTAIKIHNALERLRAMMCPRTPAIHILIHKYGDFYVLDDDLYAILEQIGNPYQALRLEFLIRATAEKYLEIENNLDEILEIFDPNLIKSEMLNKFKPVKKKNIKKEINKTKSEEPTKEIKDFVAHLIEKSRKLAPKYNPKFPEGQVPEIYKRWKETLNIFIGLKLGFDEINEKLDTLRSYYSGKKQIMPYLTFIRKSTFDEDNLSETIKSMLTQARNQLKRINDDMEKYTKKDLKLMNLDLERIIIDLPEQEEE